MVGKNKIGKYWAIFSLHLKKNVKTVIIYKRLREYEKTMNEYTVMVRKSKLEYVGVCLDLNVSARGVDLADVENNLFSAIQLYLQDIEENPDTVVSPIPTGELSEFLQADNEIKKLLM